VPGEEADRAVGLETRQLLVRTPVGVQRLLLRGEGVEQREAGLAIDMLVVPLQVDSIGMVIWLAASASESGQNRPKTAAVILGLAAASGHRQPQRGDLLLVVRRARSSRPLGEASAVKRRECIGCCLSGVPC
jgi:hypothetical protein